MEINYLDWLLVGRTSPVWQYFQYVSNGIAKCKLCGEEVPGSGNTSNYSVHLKRKHQIQLSLSKKSSLSAVKQVPSNSSDEIDDFEASESEPQISPSRNGNTHNILTTAKEQQSNVKNIKPATIKFQRDKAQTKIDDSFRWLNSFKENGPGAKNANEKLIYMLTKDCMPLRTVEKSGFKAYSKALNPSYCPPGKNKVADMISTQYQFMADKLKASLSRVEEISLTTDIWTDKHNTQSYLGVTAHYIEGDTNKSVTIGVKDLHTNHTSANIETWFEEIMVEWGFHKNQVVTVASDNAPNIVNAIYNVFGKEKHIACFAHTLNLVPADLFEKDPVVSPLIKKVKGLVTFFRQSVTAMDLLREKTAKKLKQSSETRWNSTLDMLVQFDELSEHVGSVLLKLSQKKSDSNSKTQNPNRQNRNQVPDMLTSQELSTIKEIIEIMKPFKTATTFLCGQNYVTASSMIPVADDIDHTLKTYFPESTVAEHLLEKLKIAFDKRFRGIQSNTKLAIATILDPRYKNLHITDEGAYGKALERLLKQLCDLESEGRVLNENVANSSNESNRGDVSSGSSRRDELLKRRAEGKKKSNDSMKDKFSRELGNYMDQDVKDLKSNPISYWNHCDHSVQLKRLAKKHLSMTATSVPSERVFSKTGRIMTADRNRIKPKRLQQILFLGSSPDEDWFLRK